MRGFKELLPLLIVVVIVTVILLNWLRSGAQFIARSRAGGGAAVHTPAAGTFVAPSGAVAVGLPPAPPTPDARLRQIATALLMYAGDYDNRLPPMNDPVRFEFVLSPYVRQQDVFFDPINRTRFGINTSLSFQSLNAISNTAGIAVFYQQKPDPKTKKRWVAFLDGHVKAVDEKAWQQLSKASGIGKKPASSDAKRKTQQN